eukprot:1051753-Ditylum_brightwellii.AAC.1
MDPSTTQARKLDLLKRMGKFLPTLQALYNITLRCQRLVRNMVVQLGGCATPIYPETPQQRRGSYSSTASSSSPLVRLPVFGNGVHLLPVGEAIGKVLRILITVDFAIRSN